MAAHTRPLIPDTGNRRERPIDFEPSPMSFPNVFDHSEPPEKAETPPAKRRRIDKSSASIFVHEPLADPEKQIRLLRILPGSKDDDIQLEISTWNLDNAPWFHGISYTWGELRWRIVWVNNQIFHVRENCQYALWQVRIHYPDHYIWMDAICIDQGERIEKGYQVKMMGQIYQRANRVLACVGPHGDNSESLVRMVAHVEAYEPSLGFPYGQELFNRELYDFDDFEADFARYQGPESFKELCWAMQPFIERNYWNRLWVVQELAAANSPDEVDVFCGEHALLKTTLDLLFVLYCDYMELSEEVFHYYWTLDVDIPIRSLGEALKRFRDFKCSDLRDRVYGILSLLELDDVDGPHILPDYTITTEVLAAKVCALLSLPEIRHVLGAFEMSPLDHKIRTLVHQRQLLKRVNHEPSPGDIVISWKLCGTCVRICRGLNGQLTLPLQHAAEDQRLESSKRMTSIAPNHLAARHCKPIFCSEHDQSCQPIGFVCGKAREGDFAVPFDRFDDYFNDKALIVRNSRSHGWEVIGQMVLCMAWGWSIDAPMSSSVGSSSMVCCMDLELSVNDCFVLVGQSMEEQPQTEDDYSLLLERLITSPTVSPSGTANIARLWKYPPY